MNLLESRFISLRNACETVIGEGCYYPPINFLADPSLYSDFIANVHVAGSITTPNQNTMGDSDLSYKLQGIHNRKVRLPARTRRVAQRISRYQDTNLHSCVSAGLLNLATLGQDGKDWYKFAKAAAGSNFDVVASTLLPRDTANLLLFERLGSFLKQCGDHGSTLSIVDNGRIQYVHYHSAYYPRSQHFNFFLFEGSHLDPWNTTRSSRTHQVRELKIVNGNPGFYTEPRFYTEPGKLNSTHNTLGAHLSDVAKEIRLVVTNPPHQLDIASFTANIPANKETSASQESIWLGNILVAALENADLTWTLLEQLKLMSYIDVNPSELDIITESMARADQSYFRYPKRPIYLNSQLHKLEQLAPLVSKVMTMPFSEFKTKSLQDNHLHKVINHRYFYHSNLVNLTLIVNYPVKQFPELKL
ncbi:MAG: hypothetical protein E6P95_01910 [Candidatus Moraniibacteriota bacterium]|nr:MAG: hypothetical protein E6P95_01910 [Candidatus Moranbacteria bacterium]